MPREWWRSDQWWVEQLTLAQLHWASPEWIYTVEPRIVSR